MEFEVKVRPLQQGERIKRVDFYVDAFDRAVIREKVPWRQKNNKGNVLQHYRITHILKKKNQ